MGGSYGTDISQSWSSKCCENELEGVDDDDASEEGTDMMVRTDELST
jgi:hypothetical protein